MRGAYRLAGPRARQACVHRVNSRHSGSSYSGEMDSADRSGGVFGSESAISRLRGGFRPSAGGSGEPPGFLEILAKTGLVVVHSVPG